MPKPSVMLCRDADERDGARAGGLADGETFRQVVQTQPGGDGKRQAARAGGVICVLEPAEDGAVEVHEAQEAGADADREDQHHRRE